GIVVGGLVPAVFESRPSGSELAARSWKSLRQAFKAMPAFYVGTFLICSLPAIGLDVVMTYPAQAAALLHVAPLSTAFALSAAALQGVMSLAVIAIAAVATHRFILLDDIHPKVGRIGLQFFLWLALVVIVLVLLDVAKALDRKVMPDSGLTVGIGCAIWVMKLVVGVYCALIFPAVAIGEPTLSLQDRIETSWERMDGNFWLFFRADIVALLPLILAMVLSILVIGILPLSVMIRMSGFVPALNILETIVRAIINLLSFPIFMVQAAIASWLYAWVRRAPELVEITP
ncbi:MAG TPA: hypothetical protein VNY75_03505, partial [Rhizomicrobium sp.]|nr:hypothetical protein [Rhizomicrobium sp.]